MHKLMTVDCAATQLEGVLPNCAHKLDGGPRTPRTEFRTIEDLVATGDGCVVEVS